MKFALRHIPTGYYLSNCCKFATNKEDKIAVFQTIDNALSFLMRWNDENPRAKRADNYFIVKIKNDR